MKNLKVAITGATGLVGSRLCEYLAQKGYQIRALVRTLENTAPFNKTWSKLNIEIQQTNILNRAELEQSLKDIDIVIHAAGIVDPYAAPEEITAVNVIGTQSALETAIQTGAKQFIFLSSLSVITGNDDQYNTAEDAPRILCGESYADSKVHAEQIATNDVYKNKIAITIMRPGFIYGPRERAWLPNLINAIASRRAILVDGGSKETNVIYIDNLCQAIESSMLNEKAYGQIYNLTDGQHITKKQLFDTVSDNMGLPRVEKNMPSWLIKPIFSLLSSIISRMPLEKKKKLARFSKAAYRLIGINQSYSIAKAQKELNYTNLIPFTEGMAKTLESFKEQAAAFPVKQTVKAGR